MPSPRSICAAGTLRRATRSIARLYDARLAGVGLTTAQFSILQSLARATEPVPLSELADEQVYERTSLYRTLTPLQQQKLIVIRAGRGRAKVVSLTALGAKRIAAALPHWEEAQDEFLARYGNSAWGMLAAQLGRVVEAAKGISA
jgi:DNA-binding MarR family transcriptional regulator